MLKKILSSLFHLPSIETRKFWRSFLYRGYIKKGIRIDRDNDYILYQAGAIAERIGYVFLVLLVIDVIGHIGLLIDWDKVSNNKMIFVGAWGKLMASVILIFTTLSYLRVRLCIDLKNDQIPFFVYKESLKGKTRREWIGNMSLVAVAFVVMFPLGFFFTENLFRFNDWIRVSFLQYGCLISIPFCVSVGASAMLILEKAIRFFPEAQNNLENW